MENEKRPVEEEGKEDACIVGDKEERGDGKCGNPMLCVMLDTKNYHES
jgi:hypothetical protein